MHRTVHYLFKAVGTLLVIWFTGAALSAPLRACCLGAEPCCAAQVCPICCITAAAAPVATSVTIAAPGKRLPLRGEPVVLVHAEVSPGRPWRPPDLLQRA